MKKLIVVIITFYSYWGYSQKEANIWCFGQQAMVDFNSGKALASHPPTGMYANFGCAGICSPSGKLLFYTMEGYVFDNTHRQVPYQGGLYIGDFTQTSMITPRPDSSSLYYIFTTQNPGMGYVYYTPVDIRLNSGKGDVTNPKFTKLPTFSAGKITSVKHANRKDYWIITPQFGTDTIHAYLLTASGVSSKPVASSIGFKLYSSSPFEYLRGYMKMSPDGKKVSYVNNNDSSIIADFNPATGKITNPWVFRLESGFIGLEFSPKSKYLYMGDLSNKYRIIQYDLSKKTKAAFLASRKTVDSGSIITNQTAMQVAPDGKIYISEFGQWQGQSLFNKYLHVIHAPDSAGVKARFEKNNLYLAGTVTTGALPDFIQSIFVKKSFDVKQNCKRDTAFFTISNTYDLDSAKWDFGDPSSGISNTSKKTSNVFHCYKKQGLYTARLISFHKQYKDTIHEKIFVNNTKPYLGKDTIICNSDKISLSPSGDYTLYKWNTNEKTKKILTDHDGEYILKITDYDGCVNADTIEIKYMVKANFSISSKGQCLNDEFTFKETTAYLNYKQKQARWYFSDGSSFTGNIVYKKFSVPGIHTIKLVSENQLGCKDSLSKKVSVDPRTKINFSINKTEQCFKGHSFDFKILKDTGKVSYQWDLGDKSVVMPNDISGKTYLKAGTYKVSLMTNTLNNCRDTLSKTISILPSPRADFSWDLACPGSVTKFQYTGSKPVDIFDWYFQDKGISNLENPTQVYDTIGAKKVKLIVVSDNKCEDSLIKEVVIRSKSKADFTTADVCETDSATFTNQSKDAGRYKWKFGDAKISEQESPKHIYEIAGKSTTFNVTLVAIVPNGCSDSITKALTINANPISDFSYIITGSNLELKAKQANNSKYTWKFGKNDSIITSTETYTYTFTKSGQYRICLTVSNIAACQSINCKDLTLGISTPGKQKGFIIYPNPTKGNFIIEIDKPEKDISISIYDLLGNMIKSVGTLPNRLSYEIDLNVANGIYLVRVKNGDTGFNQKVIVSK